MDLQKLCSKKNRIPIDFRRDKEKAISLLTEIKDKNIKINNSHIYSLASWVGFNIGKYDKKDLFSEVESIKYGDEEDTYDMHIKDGNSYVANGIICHNTLNLPEDVSVEEVAKIYEMAWKEGCFKEGNSIYTTDGLKNIEDIKPGNEVIGEDGKEHRVTKIFHLESQKRGFIDLKICGSEDIKCTFGHPLLTVEVDPSEDKQSWVERRKKKVWKDAKDVSVGDYVLSPKNFQLGEDMLDNILISDYITYPHLWKDGFIYPSRTLPWKKYKTVIASNSNGVKNKISIDEDFVSFLGWFIAEGYFQGTSTIRLTLSTEEQEIALWLGGIVQEKFGLSPDYFIIESNGGKRLRIEFRSKILSQFLEMLVGKGSANKHLPQWFMKIGRNLLKKMVDAHFEGDTGVTISKRLARELHMARLFLGEKSHFEQNYGQGFCVRENDSVKKTVAQPFEDYICYRVFNKKEIYETCKVYNFSVENNDTYIVNGIITHNCKGVTVYRKNCRTGVLVDNISEEKEMTIKKTSAIKRPKMLPADIYHTVSKGESYFVMVGMLGEDPYEVFAGKNGEIKRSIKKGMIKKISRGRYSLLAKNGEVIQEDISRHIHEDQEAVTRLISSNLRHGCDVSFIVHQLEKVKGDLLSYSKAIARVLKRYIPDNTRVHGETCKECGAELVRTQGCCTCNSCGWSKCS